MVIVVLFHTKVLVPIFYILFRNFRRLRDRLKDERGKNTSDIEFVRCNRSVNEEIEVIDANVRIIMDYLENKTAFEGIRDSLKTRLVHYLRDALEPRN